MSDDRNGLSVVRLKLLLLLSALLSGLVGATDAAHAQTPSRIERGAGAVAAAVAVAAIAEPRVIVLAARAPSPTQSREPTAWGTFATLPFAQNTLQITGRRRE